MRFTYKHFLFYAKSDLTKEPIDKILACDYEGALFYFAGRKKMDHNEFLEIYEIEEDGSR